jgi:DNA-binding LacI/PurR family transcriptional regulator
MGIVPQRESAGSKIGPGRGAPLLPFRSSLPTQTAAIILEHIRRGRWRDWLPGERQLSGEFRVSRGTVRSALGILEHQRAVAAVSSEGHRVLQRARRQASHGERTMIGLLSPEPLENRRPYLAMMISHIREAAQARGWGFQRHSGPNYFGPKAESHLSRLIAESGCTCWILARATRRAQAWFAGREVPTVISGHTYEGIALPSVDVDHRAAGRHAGNHLARQGHSHVALIVSRERLPGLIAGEAGFTEGFCPRGTSGRNITRLPFESSPAALAAAVERSCRLANRPTAIVTETPDQYLAVFSALARLRLRVPEEISLVSRLDDPFLHSLVPEPARYQIDPALFARSLTTLLAHVVAGEKVPPVARELVPEFIPGASIRPPRQ